MDDATFGLNECQRVFFGAGIRFILRPQNQNVSREIHQSISFDDLPDVFQKLFTKNLSGSKTLWTYTELSADLVGMGSPVRSEYFKKLIHRLSWPKGSICFWPFTVFEKKMFQPRLDYFLFGLQNLSPHAVVVFGLDSFQASVEGNDNLKSYVDEKNIPFLWLKTSTSIGNNPIVDQNTISKLQGLMDSIS